MDSLSLDGNEANNATARPPLDLSRHYANILSCHRRYLKWGRPSMGGEPESRLLHLFDKPQIGEGRFPDRFHEELRHTGV